MEFLRTPTPPSFGPTSRVRFISLELGDLEVGPASSLADLPFADRSVDLGIRFFVGPKPPTVKQLAALTSSAEPKELLETAGAQLWIASVESNSVGEIAGLMAGNRVIAVGQLIIGESLPPEQAMTSLSQAWRSRGRSVEWKVVRNNREQSISLVAPLAEP